MWELVSPGARNNRTPHHPNQPVPSPPLLRRSRVELLVTVGLRVRDQYELEVGRALWIPPLPYLKCTLSCRNTRNCCILFL